MDTESLRARVAELVASGNQDEALALVLGALDKMAAQTLQLAIENDRLVSQHIGRTSEKIDPSQLQLFLAQLGGATVAPPETVAVSASTPPLPVRARKGHGRKPLPASLPREEVVLEPADAAKVCSTCNVAKQRIGEERSETLEYVPSYLKVIVTVRAKYACRACESGVVIAATPDQVIEGGLPGPGLLAHVLVSKYADHLPINRLAKIFERADVVLATSTLGDWIAAAAADLEPIAKRIQQKALEAVLLQADDTGLKVLDQDAPGGSKRGHIWSYLGDSTWAAFVYTPNWRAEGPLGFLAGRRGWLQADAYKGYDKIYKTGRVVEIGCWAHARRKFHEALKAGDARAAIGIDHIARMYRVEAEAVEAKIGHEELKRWRAERSRGALDALGKWIAETYNTEPPKSPLAQAVGYVVRQWDALNRFISDGRIPIDNTACERQLRPIAVGRKNYLFAGSDAGAERAATIYTIIGTCALARVEPWAYLRDVLSRLAAGWPQSRLDELLPTRWQLTA
jgi:transposase